MMKRKKLFRYYLRYVQFIGWTALLFACSDDSPEQKPDGTMETVRITIQTRANGENILELEENEYKIQTLRMYVFSDDKKLLGYHYVNNTTGEQQTVTFTMKLPTGSHTFYTIANERAAGKIKKKQRRRIYISRTDKHRIYNRFRDSWQTNLSRYSEIANLFRTAGSNLFIGRKYRQQRRTNKNTPAHCCQW